MDDSTCARCERRYSPTAWRSACPHCGAEPATPAPAPFTSVPRGMPGQWTSGPSEPGPTTPAPPTAYSPPPPYRPTGYQPPASSPWQGATLGNVVPESPKRFPKWPLAILLCVALAAGAAGATVFLRSRGHAYPSKWDPRVADLANFVERERGLQFEHPVYVDFLSDADFRKQVTEHDDLTAEDKAQLEKEEAELRAMGLVSGDVNLLDIGEELVGDATVGVYTFDNQRIAVRGTSLDTEAKATLVHELTHALQDQHFKLGDMQPETSGAQMALEAVAEADADDVRQAWVDTLSQADQDALATAEEKTSDQADFKGVPDVFVELMGFPYAFGPGLLEAMEHEKGKVGRDDLFIDPPVSEEHIILPSTYLEHQKVAKVEPPKAGPGEKVIEGSDGDFGMVTLLVVLAERIDYPTAWQAVQGWAGDATTSVEKAGKTCVRVNVEFDQAPQAERFEAAFAQWGQGFETSHTRSDRVVKIESCDPGKTAAAGRAEGHVSGIQGLSLRATTSAGFQAVGLERPKADCMSDRLIENLGVTHFVELDTVLASGEATAKQVQEVQKASLAADRACP